MFYPDPIMLTRDEQLSFCKICQNRQMDMQKGIICRLTGDIATFQYSCNDFNKDKVEAVKREEQKIEEEKPLEVIHPLDPDTLNRLRQTQDLLYAALGGLSAALIAAVLWALITVITNYQIGFMAIAVGLLAGLGVRYFGSGVDKIYGIIGAIAAVLGCLLGNLFTQVWFLADYNSLGLFDAFKLLDLPLLLAIYEEGFSPVDLFFYAIAVVEGYKFAFRKLTADELLKLKESPDFIPYPANQKARMPLVILSFVLLSVLFFSIRGDYSGKQTYYYDNGTKHSEGFLKDNLADGDWVYYNEHGSVALTGRYKSGLEDGKWVWFDGEAVVKEGHYASGIPNGTWINYFEDGIVADSGSYENGRMSGHWLYRYNNGQLASEGTMTLDKLTGEWKSFHENGQLKSIETFNEGQLTGLARYWYEDGKKLQELTYAEGRGKLLNHWDPSGALQVANGNGNYQIYFANGNLSQTGKFEAGKKTGIWKTYYENGALQMEGRYDDEDILVIDKFWDDGKNLLVENGSGTIKNYLLSDGNYEEGKIVNGYRKGLWHKYSNTGALLMESNYEQGQLNGPFKSYFLSGTINVEGTYEENNETGIWNWYFTNEQLKSSVQFVDGKKEGVQEFYNDAGIKIRSEFYIEGKLEGHILEKST